MSKTKAWSAFLVTAYLLVTFPLSGSLHKRPVSVKLQGTLEGKTSRTILGDLRYAAAALNVLNVQFYFGTVVEEQKKNPELKPDYDHMFRAIEAATQLDPYNMDAYYFAQAAFTWEAGRAEDVNRLLERGIRHRTWDFYLPFFAGFNAGYFLQDYETAADYMEQAAELTGSPLFTKLAARFHHEAGQDEMGIQLLNVMSAQASDPQIQNMFEKRKDALKGTLQIRKAVKQFQKQHQRLPKNLKELKHSGVLKMIPKDPYGGRFYLDRNGHVKTTSNLTESKKG